MQWLWVLMLRGWYLEGGLRGVAPGCLGMFLFIGLLHMLHLHFWLQHCISSMPPFTRLVG